MRQSSLPREMPAASSSLRWKLSALIAIGSVLTAVLAGVGFSLQDVHRFWTHTSAEVAAVSNIVADQVGAAVMLKDEKAAHEILASLRTDERIVSASLFDRQGACFATFHRGAAAGCPPLLQDGIRRQRESLVIASPITVDERIGTLMLVVNTPSVGALVRQYVGGGALILFASLAVAGILAIVLQARVSRPILAIAAVAQRMAASHRFEERVAVLSDDEVGVLAGSFNTMLEEIERRDAELARHRVQLEQEIAERGRVNTELWEAKEKAESTSRVKSEFLANMSHEIRTPLNGITGMIGLALGHASDAEQREQLSVAQEAARSLTAILNDILDLSKMEAGKMTLESIDFNLPETIRESLKLFELAVREKNVRLKLAIGPACPIWVRGDPVRLRQVLVNLIGNAVKFTLQGEVALAVMRPKQGSIRIEVRDTGIGIPPDKLSSIFDAFTQADGSHSRRFGGTGLGLTITRRLVGLMGGSLWAESEVGRGSSFFVEIALPLCAPPAAQQRGHTSVDIDLPRLHVLVAEDNIVNQKVVCGILKRRGWTMTVAATGEQAYQRFREDRFDVILMDVQMPEVDGLEATGLIRAEERSQGKARTPIVALTAHASAEQHNECLAHDMDAVVTKPVDVAILLKTIAGVLKTPGKEGSLCESPSAG